MNYVEKPPLDGEVMQQSKSSAHGPPPLKHSTSHKQEYFERLIERVFDGILYFRIHAFLLLFRVLW